jgi:hypothetical protein
MATKTLNYKNTIVDATITVNDNGSISVSITGVAPQTITGQAIDLSKLDLEQIGEDLKDTANTFSRGLICLIEDIADTSSNNNTDNITIS